MLLNERYLRCVSYDKLFTGSSRVHGLSSIVVFSMPLDSYHASPILSCSLRRLKMVLSFLLTSSNDTSIHATKKYLHQYLNIHDSGSLRYFLKIEFAY